MSLDRLNKAKVLNSMRLEQVMTILIWLQQAMDYSNHKLWFLIFYGVYSLSAYYYIVKAALTHNEIINHCMKDGHSRYCNNVFEAFQCMWPL